MFEDISYERLLTMSEQELRWFDNVKKAFYESDLAYTDGRAADACFPANCRAIDTAKTLRRSFRGEDVSSKDNKRRFLEFLNLEIPSPDDGGVHLPLADARTGTTVNYTFAELVYDIRCMLHENENLNAAERPNYHILLDWSHRHTQFAGKILNGRLTCNAHEIWWRLREVAAKFITGIDAMITYANIVANSQTGSFTVTGSPPLGSIPPKGQTPT